MRVQRIMCPVDFSESSMEALDAATSLAQQHDAQLLIVYVDEQPLQRAAAASSPGDRRNLLERTAPTLDSVRFERHLLFGTPSDEIPRFARLQEVDLVVVGRHNATERMHYRCTHVCDIASRECECPVMTVKHKVEHPPWVRVDGDGWSPV